MNIPRSAEIYIDTNIIIELETLKKLSHLLSHYVNLRTVDKCIEEIHTGNNRRLNVDIDVACFNGRIYTPTDSQIVTVAIELCEKVDLDPGEQHLLAYVYPLKNVFFLCSPDKACIRAAKEMGILDKMVTLEDLLASAGISTSTKLPPQFTRQWHQSFRTFLELENS